MKSKDRCRHIHCCCHCQSDGGNQEMDVTKTRRRIEDVLRKNADPWLLAKIAELLGVEVAFNRHLPETDVFVYERPCFGPDQVRCIYQIQEGLEYDEVFSHPSVFTKRLTVIAPPYQNERGDWWVEVRKNSEIGGGTYEERISLADKSVVPYEMTDGGNSDERWNAWNFLRFTYSSKHLAILHCRAYGACCHNSHHHCCDAH